MGWVAPGECSPGAPSNPDLRIARVGLVNS